MWSSFRFLFTLGFQINEKGRFISIQYFPHQYALIWDCTYFRQLPWCLSKFSFTKICTYRIRANVTPLLNRTSPNSKCNTTPVKNWFWNNRTPARIQPHLSGQEQKLSDFLSFYPLAVQTNFNIFEITDWTPIFKTNKDDILQILFLKLQGWDNMSSG